ncbi:zinc finger, CCHC-type containing protein [Tanacetum coccineum]
MTQIPQDISGPNLNSKNKRNMAESSSAPRRSERARKERNLDPDFIDSQAIIFLVEGDNENNVINKIPVLLNIYLQVPKQLGVDGYLELNTIQMDPFKLLKLDDILIVGTNMEGINETKKFLSSCFQMKDMNEVDTILEIKVKRHSKGYALNQCHCIDKIIDNFQHLNIGEANTPYESSCKLVENNERVVLLKKYTSNPSQDHWKAIERVLGYLKRTRQLALYYDCFPTILEGYSDASWITGDSDSKSTTGCIFTLGGGAVSRGSKKQTCITHSTMEAEFLYQALASQRDELYTHNEVHPWLIKGFIYMDNNGVMPAPTKGELLLEISNKLALAQWP